MGEFTTVRISEVNRDELDKRRQAGERNLDDVLTRLLRIDPRVVDAGEALIELDIKEINGVDARRNHNMVIFQVSSNPDKPPILYKWEDCKPGIEQLVEVPYGKALDDIRRQFRGQATW